MQVRQIAPIKYYVKDKISRQWGSLTGLGEIKLGFRKRAKLEFVDTGLNLLGRLHLNYLRAVGLLNAVSRQPQQFSKLPLESLRLKLGEKRRVMEVKSIDGQALNHSPDLVCFFDTKHCFRWMNTATLEKLGYDSTDLIGREFVSILHPADVALARERFASLLETQRSNPCELRLRKRTGGYIWGWVVGRVLMEKGKSVGAVVHIRDITERKRNEVKKIIYQRLNTLMEVWGGLNHEINNTIFPILGYIEMYEKFLAADLATPEKAERCLKSMIQNAGRVHALTRRLQLFGEFAGRSKTGGDLISLIDAVLNHQDLKFLKGGISVIRRGRLAPDQVRPLQMKLHFPSIQMMLFDLINNAVDAINMRKERQADFERELTISLGLDGSEGKEVAVLEIRDTGCGIEPEDLEKIYEPFFTTKPAGKGTGLGMMMVQHVVQEHRGSVEVESAPGKGTTVTVRLPVL